MIDSDEDKSSLFLLRSCGELRKDFLNLKTRRDISKLLDVPYGLFVYHVYKVPASKQYKQFSISKKSGGIRTISAPATALKIIQRKLSQVLYSVYVPKAPVHGFVPNRSIVTNAKQHVNKRYVFNIDIADFFGTIHFGRVRGVFIAPPYNLPARVATALAKICCLSNKLPQGAPTSPVVSNMICARLDSQLRLLAKEKHCTYTRYADDITFSTRLTKFPHEIACEKDNEDTISIGERLLSIVKDNGFKINFEKVRLQHKNYHQEVTGLTVNQFPNVDRRFVRQISSMLHVWKRFGLVSARKSYRQRCIDSLREHNKALSEEEIAEKEFPFFEDVLRGKINFLRMVREKDDFLYRKYWGWYRELEERSKASVKTGV